MVCANGTWGSGCRLTCGHCSDVVCHSVTGYCPQGCTDGYYGPKCDAGCTCPNGSTCSPITGRCSPAGRSDKVAKMAEDDFLSPDVRSLVGTSVILAFLVVVAIFFRWHRKNQSPAASEEPSSPPTTSTAPRHRRSGVGMTSVVALTSPSTTLPPSPDLLCSDLQLRETKGPSRTTSTFLLPDHVIQTSLASRQSQAVLGRAGLFWYHPGQTGTSSELAFPQSEEVVRANFLASGCALDGVELYLLDGLCSGALSVFAFGEIPPMTEMPREAASVPINLRKNRYANIKPYDWNRVVLQDDYNFKTSNDYYNASYISGYLSEKKYIAAQGPRESTAVDLWRLVWQEKIHQIIMLTKLTEAGTNKCSQYWPALRRVRVLGPFEITAIKEDFRPSIIIRRFSILQQNTREEREVTHYQYLAWPDFGAPDPTSLVRFWRFVMARAAMFPDSPLLIHCSAGVGRTGTFIGLDIGFQQAVHEGRLDVLAIIRRLRSERSFMVNSVAQFVFLHKALLEAYSARTTFRSLEDFVAAFPQPVVVTRPHPVIDVEFLTLSRMHLLVMTQTHDIAEEFDNFSKNRNVDLLPPDNHLVKLRDPPPDRNSYINAVYLTTFRQEAGCILTQLPLPDTLTDFWAMVYEEAVETIISLASPNEEKQVTPYCWYWPRNGQDTIHTGPYTIRHQFVSKIGDHITCYSLRLEREGQSSSGVHVLRHENWVGEVPCNTCDLMHLVDMLHNTSTGDGFQPRFVIQCSDGVTKSGLVSVVFDVMNSVRYDRDIDIYMAARHVQSVRPQAVTSEIQYRFLYALVQSQAEEMLARSSL